MKNNDIKNNTHRYRTLVMLILLLAPLTACGTSSIKLWLANSLADNGRYQQQLGISYGELPRQQLDIYFPSAEPIRKALPVVVFFYGGCWGACTDYHKQHYRFVAEALVGEVVVVVADYRRYPQVLFADLMSDAVAVVQWAAANGKQFGADPDNIFLMGHSSGAHMAAMLALNEHYWVTTSHSPVSGFIGLAGPYDFLPFDQAYQRELFGPEQNYPASQPIAFVSGSEAPMLLLYGELDSTVKEKNMVNLAARVKNSGGMVETKTYKGVDHTGIIAALSIPLRGKALVRDDIFDFIARISASR